jgi:topology modulation protein
MSYRIFIYGGFCSGKTYLAKRLSEKYKIKLYSLDNLYWYGNWEHISKEKLLNDVMEIVEKEDDWIIEGNYENIRNYILPYCNIIYFCWMPMHALFYRCFKRSFDVNKNGVPQRVREQTSNKEPVLELLYHVCKYRFGQLCQDKKYISEIQEKMEINIRILKCNKKNCEREVAAFDQRK